MRHQLRRTIPAKHMLGDIADIMFAIRHRCANALQCATMKPEHLDLLLTLVIFVVMLLAFLIAPLVALALGYLAYVVWRPRSKKSKAFAAPGEPHQPGVAHGFGSGAA